MDRRWYTLLTTLSDDAIRLSGQLPPVIDHPDLSRQAAERIRRSIEVYCQQTKELNRLMTETNVDARLLRMGATLESIFHRMRDAVDTKLETISGRE